jgi:hypothetical protein
VIVLICWRRVSVWHHACPQFEVSVLHVNNIVIVQVLAMVVIIFGVWMSTRHDACRKSLTIPVAVLSIGAVIFLMSVILQSLWFWCLIFVLNMFSYYIVLYHIFVLHIQIHSWFFGCHEKKLHIAMGCILVKFYREIILWHQCFDVKFGVLWFFV